MCVMLDSDWCWCVKGGTSWAMFGDDCNDCKGSGINKDGSK